MVDLTNAILSLSAPSGLWAKIIYWIESFTGNFGWTVILFTILTKLVMSPLDFYNRYSTRKNTLIQKRLAPQVMKINKKYANNKDMANQQTAALYKREGYNMIGSCLFMLVNLVLTITIFFSIFGGLRNITAYKMLNEYVAMETVYDQTLTATGNVEQSQSAVLEYYNTNIDGKDSSWLWIDSVWVSDGKDSPILDYKDFYKTINSAKIEEYKEYVEQDGFEAKYNTVTSLVKKEHSNWNGYYILAILAAGFQFLAQWISEKSTKVNNKKDQLMQDPNQQTGKIMKIMMPILMVIFVIGYSSAFALYIVAGSIFSIILSLIINVLVSKFTKKEEEKYLKFLDSIKDIPHNTNKVQAKPEMKTYKKLGDKF